MRQSLYMSILCKVSWTARVLLRLLEYDSDSYNQESKLAKLYYYVYILRLL